MISLPANDWGRTFMYICIDMDGTIVDLYNYPDWLGALTQDENADPYRYCAPLVDCRRLRNAINCAMDAGIDVYIVSWNCGGTPSRAYRKQVTAAKRRWLQAHGIPYTRLRVVGNGTPKSGIIDGPGVLFDDEKRNREEWEASGRGRAYSPEDMIRRIMQIATSAV